MLHCGYWWNSKKANDFKYFFPQKLSSFTAATKPSMLMMRILSSKTENNNSNNDDYKNDACSHYDVLSGLADVVWWWLSLVALTTVNVDDLILIVKIPMYATLYIYIAAIYSVASIFFYYCYCSLLIIKMSNKTFE